jgi:hypothetical protein
MKSKYALIILGVLLIVLSTPTLVAAQETPLFTIPEPVIKIPGLDKLSDPQPCPASSATGQQYSGCYTFPWIGEYISGLYRFAVMATTILATIVLMIAGFLWLTAGGNSSQVSTAKEYMSGAILGLILMLGSYTVLYLVNPSLTVFPALSIPIIRHVDLKEYIQTLKDQGATLQSCPAGNLSNDQSRGVMLDPAYEGYFNAAATAYGIDPVFLASIARVESGLGRNIGPSTAGAYGVMQIMPKTAAEIWRNNPSILKPAECSGANDPASGSYTATCKNWIASHPDINIMMGAAYINSVRGVVSECAQAAGFDATYELIAAGYNAGPYRRSICGGDIPPIAQTIDYVKKVNGFMNEFCNWSTSTTPPTP